SQVTSDPIDETLRSNYLVNSFDAKDWVEDARGGRRKERSVSRNYFRPAGLNKFGFAAATGACRGAKTSCAKVSCAHLISRHSRLSSRTRGRRSCLYSSTVVAGRRRVLFAFAELF